MARLCMCAAICLALALAPLTFAAWPNDPAQNLVICNCLGQQIAPKLATTSSGGCYIGWYDNDSGNFDVYLQRLNEHGVPQWQENGVCVDGNPQLAQITDWDLAVDHSDHCVVAVNDARGGGGNLNVYGYRIGPGCSFDWGGGGLAMSDNDDREPDPRLAVTTGGNVVFVWEQETATGSVVNLRKVNPDGGNCWFPYTLTLSSDHGISAPRVVACEDDGVIVQYLKAQSSDPQGERYIYVQKFNSQAVSLWPNGGVAVCTAGGIESGAEPEIIADGRGGIYCYWHDARIPDSYHAYVQHIDSSGTPLWTENGVRLSLTETQLQMKPALVAFPGTGEVMAFYETTDANHTPHGLAGQLISAAGDRPWGYHGVTFVPMGELSPCNILAFPLNDGAIVVYREFAPGS
ncbi:hypothetical protein KJ815_13920, partial [bacterium]|nr:hypothetical protein [bacterium]